MMRPLFQGRLVRLSALDPDLDAAAFAAWSENSQFDRLLSAEPARPLPAGTIRNHLQRSDVKPGEFTFGVRTLGENQLVGFVSLEEATLPHGEGWVSIGIGAAEDWGRGYGSDAMRELLRFAFSMCNLHRISLNVFGYNERALRLYRKLGFTEEGRVRGALNRDGQRWDLIYMGLLASEWKADDD